MDIKNKPLINRFNIQKRGDVAQLLSDLAIKEADKQKKKTIAIIGPINSFSSALEKSIKESGYQAIHKRNVQLNEKELSEFSEVGCIVGAYFDSKNLTRLGISLVDNIYLREIPFEYVLVPGEEYKVLREHDWQESISFISPLLIKEVDYFGIYEESLTKFERKCQIRDYMDLCQLIQEVLDKDIDGDIAEFGSYKGHSGYLIAQILKASNSKKMLYMFDMFDQFPGENLGIDALWNDTHHVDFAEVKSKMSSFDNVVLIKGDFIETLQEQHIKQLSLVYIDCDSYKGTNFLLENLFDNVLVSNGIMVLEDYGHAPLLGNRLAFHQFFDKRNDCFKFFSQFSGFQIVIKNS